MNKRHNERGTKEQRLVNRSVLLDEVKQKLKLLRDSGVSESEIASLLYIERTLPKLLITKNYKLILDDCCKEVHMEPLVKAVYLLFLKHPEGIIFKNLPDYRKELTFLYDKVRPWGLTERTLQSIEDVTNPTLNSINEKCARIKKAFLSVMESDIAEHYFVKGTRGEPKGIDLPRNLVIWE